LLRGGLPSDKVLLAQVSPEAAEATLTAVRDASIVEMSNADIAAFKSEFQKFSTAVRLALPVPGANTSYGDLLATTGLNGEKQRAFADVYLEYGAIPVRLWETAREKGLSGGDVARLQLHGKLAFLTGSSPRLIERLVQKQVSSGNGASQQSLNDAAQLADLGLYTAEKWKAELDAAGQDDSLIPPKYIGDHDQRIACLHRGFGA